MASEIEDDNDEMAGVLKAGFPDIRCLRCGHDKLYVVSDSHGGLPGYFSPHMFNSKFIDPDYPLLAVACARCGHVEHFLTGLLRDARKPIPTEGRE